MAKLKEYLISFWREIFDSKVSTKNMPEVTNKYHIRIEKVENLAGFAAEDTGPGEMAKILVRAFVHSDQPEFYLYSEQISKIFLNKYYQVDGINTYLIIIHKDLSADVYVNNVPMVIKVLAKRDVKAGEAIRINDIADMDELKFQGIEIKRDDNLIFCFKKGWKFGLFFDFQQVNNNFLDLGNLYHELGSYYKYLTFQKEYAILENNAMFDEMFNDGWFPFIQLLGGDFIELSVYYKDKIKFATAINKFLDKFGKNRIDSFINRWWRNKIFSDKKSILMAGVEAYLQNINSSFILSIKTLYSEIEGIVRINFVNENNKEPTFAELMNYVTLKAKGKFVTKNSLGFPDIFFQYLQEVIFKNFDLQTGEVDLSRHTVSHGVAKPEDYNRMRALQAILVLDQMYFYLA